MEHLLTWGVHISVSYLLAFSYCWWGSQGKNTEVVCHALLQRTTFCQNSSLWPVHLGWPYTTWLIVSLNQKFHWIRSMHTYTQCGGEGGGGEGQKAKNFCLNFPCLAINYDFYFMMVRPNKWKHQSLEQRKLYCSAKQGEWVVHAQNPWTYWWFPVAQSCLTLYNPMDCSPPGSSIHGILQARILEWVARPSSKESFQPGIEPRSPALQVNSLLSEPPGKLNEVYFLQKRKERHRRDLQWGGPHRVCFNVSQPASLLRREITPFWVELILQIQQYCSFLASAKSKGKERQLVLWTLKKVRLGSIVWRSWLQIWEFLVSPTIAKDDPGYDTLGRKEANAYRAWPSWPGLPFNLIMNMRTQGCYQLVEGHWISWDLKPIFSWLQDPHCLKIRSGFGGLPWGCGG